MTNTQTLREHEDELETIRAQYLAKKAAYARSVQPSTQYNGQGTGRKEDLKTNQSSTSYASTHGKRFDMSGVKLAVAGHGKKQKIKNRGIGTKEDPIIIEASTTSSTPHTTAGGKKTNVAGNKTPLERRKKKLRMRFKKATVEDERASRAREVGGTHELKDDDYVPNKGTIDQECVLEEVL